MKAILEYDLNEFDDKQAHFRAVKSLDMALCLWGIRHINKDECETADQVFSRLNELFEDYNILIDELVT